MRVSEVERWAVEVIGAIERGDRGEDDRVEIKRQPKATPIENARRIAGHANQARDSDLLWIFGLDEDGTRHALVPDLLDPNKWWAPIEALFDEVAPSPVFAHVDGLLAVGFDVERAPFVIKHPDGQVSREVPWREGTRIRSANRYDLLRLLVPISRVPSVVPLDGFLNVVRVVPDGVHAHGDPSLRWSLEVWLYADTADGFVAPDHLITAEAVLGPDLDLVKFTTIHGTAASYDGASTHSRRDQGQVVVTGPSQFRIVGSCETQDVDQAALLRDGRLNLSMGLAGGGAVRIDVGLATSPAREPGYSMGSHSVDGWAGWSVNVS